MSLPGAFGLFGNGIKRTFEDGPKAGSGNGKDRDLPPTTGLRSLRNKRLSAHKTDQATIKLMVY